MKVDALVLAGGSSKNLESEGVPTKASIKIDGRPMVEYVIDSLKKSKFVGKIAVVASPMSQANSWLSKADLFVTSTGTLTENMSLGLSTLDSPYPVLIISSDVPLITTEAIDDFINRCEDKSAEFFYPIISKEVVEASFPTVKRTYASLREGIFTGGNMGLVNAQVILQNMETVERAYQLRKSPVKLLWILGLRFVLKFIFHRLTITELEEAVSRLLNFKSRAIPTLYPQIGVDVDKISDLDTVRRALASGEKAGSQ